MVWRISFVLAAEILCEWTSATKVAGDCECDGLVRSVPDQLVVSGYKPPKNRWQDGRSADYLNFA